MQPLSGPGFGSDLHLTIGRWLTGHSIRSEWPICRNVQNLADPSLYEPASFGIPARLAAGRFRKGEVSSQRVRRGPRPALPLPLAAIFALDTSPI